MVKGITRQVIVVRAPDQKLFDQAIFILNENASQTGISDDALLKEAEQVIRTGSKQNRHRRRCFHSVFWACAGALATGAVWLFTILL